MRISKSELNKKYGINLPAGKYQINSKDHRYEIFTVKDDTEGCLLVGYEQHPDGTISTSRIAINNLKRIIKEAITRRNNSEEVWITIR